VGVATEVPPPVRSRLTRAYFETGPRIRQGRGKSRASLDLIDAAYDFLEEANPTTVRGVAYHLFTKGLIGSMSKNETARVSRLLTDAREQGMIPWAWIVDETRKLERTPSWSDPAEFVAVVVRERHRSRCSGAGSGGVRRRVQGDARVQRRHHSKRCCYERPWASSGCALRRGLGPLGTLYVGEGPAGQVGAIRRGPR
jgi:hypothetical protein